MKTKNNSGSMGAQEERCESSMNKNNPMLLGEKSLSEFLELSEGTNEHRAGGLENLPDLLEQAEAFEESVYFYGATEELLKKITQKAMIEYPELKIVGFYAPPSRTISKEEDAILVKEISEAKPNLVLVSQGRQKQEKWIAEHENKIKSRLLGLGRAFKRYASQETRLHKWMRTVSLEWLYRLCLKPAKMWKRYRLKLLVSYYVLTDAHIYG